jgi:TP901 family phage tail tape measure protein
MASAGSLNEIAEIFVSLGLSTDGMDDAKREIKGKMKGMSRSMKRSGRQMTTYLTGPLAAASAAAVKTAADFDKQFAKIEGLVDAGEDVDALKSKVQGLAGETAKAPQELAEALFFVESAGFRGEKAMSVLEASSKAAAAGLGETKEVADAVTSAVNAYGKENLSASRATDTLVATIREGKVEASELSSSLGRVIPTAAEIGVEFEQVGASLAALTRVGANSRRAVTSLQGVMKTLLKPTSKAEKRLSEVGLSVSGLRREIADGNIITVLQKLKSAFDGNTEAISDVFSNGRALRGVLGIVGKSAEEARGIMERMADTSGSTDQAFETMNDTLSFKLSQAWQELKVVAIEWGRYVGASLIPIMQYLTSALGTLTSWWQGLSSTMQSVIGTSALVVGAMGPILWIIGSLVPGIYGLITAVGSLSGAFSTLASTAATAWAAVTGPVGLTIAAIGAVAGAVYLIMDNWSALSTFFSDLFSGIGRMIQGFGTGVLKFFSFVGQKIRKVLIDAATEVLAGIDSVLSSLGIDTFRDKVQGAISSLAIMSNAAAGEIRRTKEEGEAAFEKMREGAGEFAGNVADKTGTALGSIMSMFTSAKEEATDFFGGGAFGGGGAGSDFQMPPTPGPGSGRGGQQDGFSVGNQQQGSGGNTKNKIVEEAERSKTALEKVKSAFRGVGGASTQFRATVGAAINDLAQEVLGFEQHLESMAVKMEAAGPRMKAVLKGTMGAMQSFSRSVGRGVSHLVGQLFEMESGIDSVKDAFLRARSIIKNALKRVVQQLVQAVVRALVLKGIMAAITGGGSAAAEMVGSRISGGGLGAPAMAAEGGIVPAEPTRVIAGEGGEREAIMPLSKLDKMLKTQSMKGGKKESRSINIIPRFTQSGDLQWGIERGKSRKQRLGID